MTTTVRLGFKMHSGVQVPVLAKTEWETEAWADSSNYLGVRREVKVKDRAEEIRKIL